MNDVLVIRNEGALLYFNVDHVRDRVSALIGGRDMPPRLIVFFMGNVPHVDLAGIEYLIDLDRPAADPASNYGSRKCTGRCARHFVGLAMTRPIWRKRTRPLTMSSPGGAARWATVA